MRASALQDRFAVAAGLLDGQVLEVTDAHGKHLFLGWADGQWLHVHLGLYGTFRLGEPPAPPPVGALRLRLQNELAWADLRGPTACELLGAEEKAGLHARLGADPLRRDADPDRAWARLGRSRAPIGAVLTQQDVLAGVGNVFRAELLFRHRIEPHRPGREISRPTWDALWTDLRVLMRAGVRAGRIVTTRPEHRRVRSGRVRREDSFYVYRRSGEPCRVCGTAVASEPLLGRTLYWCPTCQPV